MVYLITQISVYLALSCLLGLAVGWLIWGELARRIRTEAARLQSKLADLEARYWTTVSERDGFEKKVLDREGEISGLHKRVLEPAMSAHETEDKITAAVAEKDEVITRLRDQHQTALGVVEAQGKDIVDVKVRLAASETHEQALNTRAREWEAMLAEKDRLIVEINSNLKEQEARNQSVVAELESKVQSLFEQHQVLASGQEKLRAAATDKESEIARMQTRLAAASASLAAATKQQQAANDEIGRLRNIGVLLTQPLPHDEVTGLAHGYAAARNFQGGSEKEDWIRAENAVRLRILQDYLSEGASVAAGA